MKIIWSSEALYEMKDIYFYTLKKENYDPFFVTDTIENKAKELQEFPFLGIEGRKSKTRELIIPKLPYFIVYTVIEDKNIVHILSIQHEKQNYS